MNSVLKDSWLKIFYMWYVGGYLIYLSKKIVVWSTSVEFVFFTSFHFHSFGALLSIDDVCFSLSKNHSAVVALNSYLFIVATDKSGHMMNFYYSK